MYIWYKINGVRNSGAAWKCGIGVVWRDDVSTPIRGPTLGMPRYCIGPSPKPNSGRGKALAGPAPLSGKRRNDWVRAAGGGEGLHVSAQCLGGGLGKVVFLSHGWRGL
jgi:hypothetical protein